MSSSQFGVLRVDELLLIEVHSLACLSSIHLRILHHLIREALGPVILLLLHAIDILSAIACRVDVHKVLAPRNLPSLLAILRLVAHICGAFIWH